MKLVATKKFESELFMEYSSQAVPQSIGIAENEMQLYISEDGLSGSINWEYTLIEEDGDGDTWDIGLWFEDDKKTLRDYDGVFSLSKQAIELLEENGYNADYAK